MRKVIASLAAGGLLVGAAFTTSVIGGSSVAVAQDTTDDTATVSEYGPAAFLDEVLQELVDEGVIQADQVEPIKAALAAKMQEMRENRPGRGHRFEARFLEDGVIDADELAQLPDDHPLVNSAEAADGQVTQEEYDAWKSAREAEREAAREQMQSFLEDGVIDADELAQLPEDHPLVNSEAAADGQITQDELAELRPPRGRGHRGPGGFEGFGPGADSDDVTAEATSF